jgi:hypothetical protein
MRMRGRGMRMRMRMRMKGSKGPNSRGASAATRNVRFNDLQFGRRKTCGRHHSPKSRHNGKGKGRTFLDLDVRQGFKHG